jgi:hypothetical protein
VSVPLRKVGLSASGPFQVGFGVPDWPGLGPGCPLARLPARLPKADVIAAQSANRRVRRGPRHCAVFSLVFSSQVKVTLFEPR